MMFAAAFVATHAAAQAPQPKGPPGDFLDAVNETPSSVKLEFFPANAPAGPGARAQMMACMSPKQTLRWPLAPETPLGRIRMQVMGGKGCDEPPQKVVCERSIERAPGLQYVTLRGEGNNCGVFPMPPPTGGMLQAGHTCAGPWSPVTITNTDKYRAVWITFHKWTPRVWPSEVLAAACWLPGETRMTCRDPETTTVRAEVTQSAGNCNGRVACDKHKDFNFYGDRTRTVAVSLSTSEDCSIWQTR
jgi:hypothetical protein